MHQYLLFWPTAMCCLEKNQSKLYVISVSVGQITFLFDLHLKKNEFISSDQVSKTFKAYILLAV